MERSHHGADEMRAQLSSRQVTPAAFRAALLSVPIAERDVWLDLAFGLEGLPEDGPQLPANCTPYLPCPVDAVLQSVEHARIGVGDVFVDVGSGLGRAALLAQLLTGASSIGIEIQSALAHASLALARRLNVSRFAVIEGDAAQLIETVRGTVFFLYCPFSGARLERVLEGLAVLARSRQIHLCCVQLPLPERSWLTQLPLPDGELAVYRSTAPGR
ncbi:MAG: hypothetical protein RL033_7296 [Pseudomonadota bacterium]|jgi:SAM-dependent methyltransferase